MMLMPFRCTRIFAGLVEIFFQLCIVGTGNYAWINFVGATPCLALFDDRFLLDVYQCGPLLLRKILLAPLTLFASRKKEKRNKSASLLVDTANIKQELPQDGAPTAKQLETVLKNGERKQDEDLNMSARVSIGAIVFAPISFCATAVKKVYLFVYATAVVVLTLFMVYKSREPLKELYSPAPWINNYDNYFFMTSQGVFGFINKLRVNLVLEYRYEDDEDAESSWRPLDFKCIPGSLGKRPCLLSPYHSRLDWETWIRTTASFEHVIDQYPREVVGQVGSFLFCSTSVCRRGYAKTLGVQLQLRSEQKSVLVENRLKKLVTPNLRLRRTLKSGTAAEPARFFANPDRSAASWRRECRAANGQC